MHQNHDQAALGILQIDTLDLNFVERKKIQKPQQKLNNIFVTQAKVNPTTPTDKTTMVLL